MFAELVMPDNETTSFLWPWHNQHRYDESIINYDKWLHQKELYYRHSTNNNQIRMEPPEFPEKDVCYH